MGRKMDVVVLFGGRSGEHEVSLMSARSVLGALDRSRYRIHPVGIAKDGTWWAGEEALDAFQRGRVAGLTPVTLLPIPGKPYLWEVKAGGIRPYAHVDVVFPVLHGTFGEDGTLQGLLELADLAYVGAGVVGSAVGMDKGIFKDVMRAHGIPTAAYVVLSRREILADAKAAAERCEQVAPYPLFVKPANLGSSVGITKAHNREELLAGLELAARYDRRVVVEQGLDAREIEVSVLGNDEPQASLPGEIVPSEEFYSYKAKYEDENSRLLIPAPLDEAQTDLVRRLAVQVYRAVDCAGMARVDFLLDRATNQFFINELNTLPGFTSISMYPKLWEASGLPYPQLLDRLIELALERRDERRQLRREK